MWRDLSKSLREIWRLSRLRTAAPIAPTCITCAAPARNGAPNTAISTPRRCRSRRRARRRVLRDLARTQRLTFRHADPTSRPPVMPTSFFVRRLCYKRTNAALWVEIMAFRCAILDDYQNVVLKVADWSKVKGDVEIHGFQRASRRAGQSHRGAARLRTSSSPCASAPAFRKQVIDALPDLKLLITTGMRNASIDTEAAKARGVTVCGTGSFGSPTSGIAIGLMLELTRHIGYENARLHAGATWQTTIGPDLEGMTLGVLGLGKLGAAHRRHRQGVRHEGHRLEPEPHAGKMPRSRRRLCRQGRPVPPVRLHHHPRRACRSARAAWSARASSA